MSMSMRKKQVVLVAAALVAALSGTWTGVALAQGEPSPVAGDPPAVPSPSAAQPVAEPPLEKQLPTPPPVATTPPPVATTPPTAPTAPTTAATPGAPARGYESPMKDQCQDELRKDAFWYATLREELRAGVHDQDAKLFVTNHKHVVMAYAAIWLVTIAFVILMGLRQRALRGDLARLQRDLDRAIGDDGGPSGGKGGKAA